MLDQIWVTALSPLWKHTLLPAVKPGVLSRLLASSLRCLAAQTHHDHGHKQQSLIVLSLHVQSLRSPAACMINSVFHGSWTNSSDSSAGHYQSRSWTLERDFQDLRSLHSFYSEKKKTLCAFQSFRILMWIIREEAVTVNVWGRAFILQIISKLGKWSILQ